MDTESGYNTSRRHC